MSQHDKTLIRTLTAKDSRATEAVQERFRLRVISGPAAGQASGSLNDSALIGSSDGANFKVSDPSVSKHHFRIEFVEDGIKLTDLGSTNGTFVDGVKVTNAFLHKGAVIQVGRSELALELTGDYATVPLSESTEFGRMFGESMVMRRLFATLERAAGLQSTVLINGESGTGKELIAEALHECGPRRDGPFVVVDCGSLVPSLCESELFGHERGAFSGAHQTREGAFERAHGGTLFLDEIGELELTIQSRLLRAIENRRTRRVGGNSYRSFDVRIIAATNRDLPQMVTTGDFREDLYYRLAVLNVRSPSLRERASDIEPLAARLLSQYLEPGADTRPYLKPEIVKTMRKRRWLGNVRELRNFVEQLATLGANHTPSFPDDEVVAESPNLLSLDYARAREAAIASFEKEYTRQALERSGGNVAQAARDIGIDRVYLFRLIRKHGLRRK